MIIKALRTITPEHQDLLQISIFADTVRRFVGPDIELGVEAHIYERWSDLDHLLIQLLESGSILPRVVVSSAPEEVEKMADSIAWLLPEVAERGFIKLQPT